MKWIEIFGAVPFPESKKLADAIAMYDIVVLPVTSDYPILAVSRVEVNHDYKQVVIHTEL